MDGVKTDQVNNAWRQATDPTDAYPIHISMALSKVNSAYSGWNKVAPDSRTCLIIIKY